MKYSVITRFLDMNFKVPTQHAGFLDKCMFIKVGLLKYFSQIKRILNNP